ncbi:MAG: hypothetical protein U0Y68_01630 [Blastocatellia bacterium]
MFVPPDKNHIVLDHCWVLAPTLVAAKKLGCSYIGIEIVLEYRQDCGTAIVSELEAPKPKEETQN